ncbi:MAG: hypothetical protein WDN75_02420 [Bacteroidota bacterium]
MAQKSRFRTTSGPTANRAEKFKKNSRDKKDSSEGSDFKKKGFAKSPFKPDRKPPFKSFGDKGKPFVKRDFRDKDGGPRSNAPEKGPKEFAERKPKSFSREDQSNKSPRKDSPQFSDRNKSYGSSGKDFSRKKFDDSAPRSAGKKTVY